MQKYALDERYNKLYCFVPVKTEYYILMWDFDLKVDKFIEDYNLKPFCSQIEFYTHINNFDAIVYELINLIIDSLNKIFINPDINYVLADKNIGVGFHLYFPNIIINKMFHSYIYDDVLQSIKKLNKYPDEIINHIFDACISKANGLRYFYYYLNDNYYKPNYEYSTFEFDEKPEKNFKYCLINTTNKNLNLKLNIDIEEINTFVHKIDKKEKKKDIRKGNIKDEIEYIQDFAYLDLKEKKSLFMDLVAIVHETRKNKVNEWINHYSSWKLVVFLFRTYGLYEEIISLSKQSNKWDHASLKMINDIFYKLPFPKICYKIGTLIKWASEDNFIKTCELLEKYNIQLKLNVSNVNDILLMDNREKINFKEQVRYISDKAVNEFILNIEKDNCDVILIQSPTDTGKSTTLVKMYSTIKKYNYTTLCLTTRKSMVNTLKTVFNYTKDKQGVLTKNIKFNFNSYLDKDIENMDEYISSLEHLFLFKQFYDVIVIDEIFSLCTHLYSKTLDGRRKECLIHLKNLISNAKIVIGCDARIADICFKLFDSKKRIYFYQNIHKNKLDIPFKIYIPTLNSEDSNLNHIAQIIGEKYCKNKKSVIVFSDRKSILNYIKNI